MSDETEWGLHWKVRNFSVDDNRRWLWRLLNVGLADSLIYDLSADFFLLSHFYIIRGGKIDYDDLDDFNSDRMP